MRPLGLGLAALSVPLALAVGVHAADAPPGPDDGPAAPHGKAEGHHKAKAHGEDGKHGKRDKARGGHTKQAAAALTLEGEYSRLRVCSGGSLGQRDLGVYDVTWKAHTDIASMKAELINPVGVRQVGPGLTIPPVNPGGAILLGGITDWPADEGLVTSRHVLWTDRESIDTHSADEGDTGLLLLRVRQTAAEASWDGVRVSWTTVDGEEGHVEARSAAVIAPDTCR